MRKKQVPYQHNALPLKPLFCSLCSYISAFGPNDLQLHMDGEHKGWAEGVIRKMNIQVNSEPAVESRKK